MGRAPADKNMIKWKDILLKSSIRANLCLALFGLAILLICPIRNTLIKLGILSFIMIAWVCVLCLIYFKRKMRYAFLGLTVLSILFCCMPSRQINQADLREDYVRALCRYESRPYKWGAENFFAVDCSGLIRQGFIDANFLYGMKTLNGALVREALLLWWYDSSAKALRDEYRGRTLKVIKTDCINELDHHQIFPGDFAVTQNGVHCLAYLGEGRWIQADPAVHKVRIDSVPVEDSSWFRQPIYIMRWSEFER